MTSTTSDNYAVLIVDDIPADLAMLSTALDASGHTVSTATSGNSALAQLAHATPDIILLSAVMREMDGFEICRRIKQMDGSMHVPVMFMTRLAETEQVLKGFQAGGIDYVTKPIQPTEVTSRIVSHIDATRLLSQSDVSTDSDVQAAIALGSDGAPIWHTSKAAAVLEKYFPGTCPEMPGLPPQLRTWLHNVTLPVDSTPPANLTVNCDRNQLTIYLTKGERSGESLLLFEEVVTAEPRSSRIVDYNITPQEADVLAWLANGKTNVDIANILGVSPRTMNQRMEKIFAKLGVKTRAAAAAISICWLYGTSDEIH